MDSAVLYILIFAVFLVVPITGLFLVILDVLHSRIRGHELDNLSLGIKHHLQFLKRGDIPEFDGLLSNWLEQTIKEINTKWIRASTRLIIQAKFVGLGEPHRDRLINDESYRRDALFHSRRLAEYLEHGDMMQVMNEIGHIFALFTCDYYEESDSGIDPKLITIEAIKNSSIKLDIGVFEAESAITNALRTISKYCQTSESGLSILILQWAKLKLLEGDSAPRRASFFHGNDFKQLPRKFLTVANLYERNDDFGVIHEIIESF
jgi:hypothetical protein